ncbi:MAG: DUF4080 domain-containing protein [Lachnospiraceae bacterium]|nr:DUF4080 domain-containing protein [Lachnospiraceae bacterium]
MTTILLTALNAKYIHTNPAVHALARCAGGDAAGVRVLEMTINNRYEDIIAAIYRENAAMIGFSVYIWNAALMQDVIRDIRCLKPDAVLFAGGPEAANDPETYLTWCDFVMLGEGETNFRRLAGDFIAGRPLPLETLSGIALPGRLMPPDARSAADMDTLPFLYEDPALFGSRILYYESSRGCPFRCSYCLSSLDKTMRYKALPSVLRELDIFLEKKVPQVKFVDRTFNADPRRSLAIWQYLAEHDNGVTNFHFEIGADRLTEAELSLLTRCRPGLIQLEIGIQSTHPQTLEAIRRACDNNRLFTNVARLRKAGNINLHTDLIAGLPYEDAAAFRKSFNEVYPLKAHQLQLGFLKVLKGTEMHKKAAEYGLVYSKRPPYEVYSTAWLSYDEMIRLHHISDAVEVFGNTQLYRHTLDYLEEFFVSPYDLFDTLACLLEEAGLIGAGVSPRRSAALLASLAEFTGTKGMTARPDPHYLQEYIRLDLRLHTHQSRKMSAVDSFDLPQGQLRLTFDYHRIDPVTGEAAVHNDSKKQGS